MLSLKNARRISLAIISLESINPARIYLFRASNGKTPEQCVEST